MKVEFEHDGTVYVMKMHDPLVSEIAELAEATDCLLYTSPSPRDS